MAKVLEARVNGLAKGGLALGGLVVGVAALKRALNPRPRYAPWEKPPYGEFENKVLVVGGGFGGYTGAKDNRRPLADRGQARGRLVRPDKIFSFLSPAAACVAGESAARHGAPPLWGGL